MAPLFLWGPLAHPAVAAAVLGREVGGETAWLEGWEVRATGPAAALVPAAGARTEGWLVLPEPGDLVRLGFYAAGFAPERRVVLVATASDVVAAVAQVSPKRPGTAVERIPTWDAAAWAARWAALEAAVAGDVMRAFGHQTATEVAARLPMLRVRAASRLRAAAAPPRGIGAGAVEVAETRVPYARFFAVEEIDVAFRRFDGAMHPPVTRAVFVSGDAATVLPWDPVRDRVLVIEQFRPGPYLRGDPEPWLLEPVAGRVDPGETPEGAARREAREEAGLALGALLPVGAYYPSPGAKTEFLYSYVGLADLPDGSAGIAGLTEEGEDIRARLMPFDALMGLLANGAAAAGPLILTALWLARHRARGGAG